MLFKKELFLKNKFLILIIGIVVFLLLGCINNKQNANDNVDNSVHQNKNNTSKAHPFVRKDKSVIRVCQSETPPVNLDPIHFDNKLDEITFHIFDRLVKWNPKGKIIPDLAESWEQIDEKTIQFKIRKGIKFHNGEPLDASSVKFSLERLINPKTKSSKYHQLKKISKIEIIDPYTIKIITSEPDYLMLRKMTIAQIIPEHYFKKVGVEYFGKHPVGTGAYKFKSWNKDGSITFTKNENYWRKGKPIIKTLIFKFIEDDLSKKAQREALFNGEVDLITQLPGINTLEVQMNENTKVIKMPNQTKVIKLVFNSLKEPFSHKEIRKAVNLALNREILIKVLTKGNGRVIATNSVKLEFGHNPDLKPYIYNPEEAKELIKESGLKDIHIKIAVTKETELIAKAIIKDLERINIKSEYTSMTIENMASLLYKSKFGGKDAPKWDYDLTIYSGVDPFMHVGFLYGIAVYSQGTTSRTNSKEFDKIYEKLVVTLDDDKQLKLCHQLESLAYDNYWYTPVFQVIGTYGAAKDLYLKDSATAFIDLTEAYYKDLK